VRVRPERDFDAHVSEPFRDDVDGLAGLQEHRRRGVAPVREGPFLLESGYHANLWLDLDALFINPCALAPPWLSVVRS
jgi:hypothetical protein